MTYQNVNIFGTKVRKSREEKREVQETRDFLAGMQMNRTSDDTAANGNGNGNARYIVMLRIVTLWLCEPGVTVAYEVMITALIGLEKVSQSQIESYYSKQGVGRLREFEGRGLPFMTSALRRELYYR